MRKGLRAARMCSSCADTLPVPLDAPLDALWEAPEEALELELVAADDCWLPELPELDCGSRLARRCFRGRTDAPTSPRWWRGRQR